MFALRTENPKEKIGSWKEQNQGRRFVGFARNLRKRRSEAGNKKSRAKVCQVCENPNSTLQSKSNTETEKCFYLHALHPMLPSQNGRKSSIGRCKMSRKGPKVNFDILRFSRIQNFLLKLKSCRLPSTTAGHDTTRQVRPTQPLHV